MKNFKRQLKEYKGKPQTGEKMCKTYLIKDLYSEHIKNSQNSTPKNKSGQRISTDIFSKIYRYPTDIKDTQHY